MVISYSYCSVGMGCIYLNCSSVRISLAVCLRYVSVETFGKEIFVGKQSIVIVSLVELVDVTKYF